MENKIMKIPIDADLINEVLNYLAKRPFGEVNNLINKLIMEGKAFEDSNQQELDIDVTE
tara:strand:- start:159 stop:335 length:177 start_codon:yes stop_codon:yes gene_type:complete